MTLLDRTLSKAYRRLPVATIPEPQGATAPDARGWLPELRAPQRSTEQTATWSWPPICRKLLDVAGDGFRQLADKLQAVAIERKLKSIGFAGTHAGVGTTSIALTLAQTLAEQAIARILLVDANAAHGEMAALLGLAPHRGLSEVALGDASLEQAVIELDGRGLFLLPLSIGVDVSALTAVKPEFFRTRLAPLREQFDLILVDAGVWTNASASLLWQKAVLDAVVCVIGKNATDAATIDKNQESARQAHIEFLGIIETFR